MLIIFYFSRFGKNETPVTLGHQPDNLKGWSEDIWREKDVLINCILKNWPASFIQC